MDTLFKSGLHVHIPWMTDDLEYPGYKFVHKGKAVSLCQMEPQEKLKQIEDEIRPWLSLMGRLADNVLDEQVSKYPIFVVHPATIELGLPIVEKGDQSRWAIHISTLEEFAVKQIILPEKIQEFRDVYKDPEDFFCLFVLSDLGAQFIFRPR